MMAYHTVDCYGQLSLAVPPWAVGMSTHESRV